MTSPYAQSAPPPPAVFVGGRPVASIGKRVGAYAIDAVIAGVVYGIVLGIGTAIGMGMLSGATSYDGMMAAVTTLFVLSQVIPTIVQIVWTLAVWFAPQGTEEGSIGYRAVGLRLVRLETGAAVGKGPAIGRGLLFGLTAMIIVGPFSPLFDQSGRRQGWHDKAIGAVVVDTRAGAGGAAASADSAAASAGSAADAVPPPPPPPPPPTDEPSAPVPAWLAGDETIIAPVGAGAVPPPPPPVDVAPAAPSAQHSGPVPFGVSAGSAAAAPLTNAGGLVSAVPGVTRAVPPVPPPPAAVEPAPPAAPSPAAAVPVAVSQPAPAPALSPGEDDDDEDLDATRYKPTRPAALLVLEWDDGTVHRLTRAALFGRNPEARDGAEIVAVADATRSLSKTHFGIVFDGDGAWIVDQHSTNGTAVERSGEGQSLLVAGERSPLRAGDVVVIADRSFSVKDAG